MKRSDTTAPDRGPAVSDSTDDGLTLCDACEEGIAHEGHAGRFVDSDGVERDCVCQLFACVGREGPDPTVLQDRRWTLTTMSALDTDSVASLIEADLPSIVHMLALELFLTSVDLHTLRDEHERLGAKLRIAGWALTSKDSRGTVPS